MIACAVIALLLCLIGPQQSHFASGQILPLDYESNSASSGGGQTLSLDNVSLDIFASNSVTGSQSPNEFAIITLETNTNANDLAFANTAAAFDSTTTEVQVDSTSASSSTATTDTLTPADSPRVPRATPPVPPLPVNAFANAGANNNAGGGSNENAMSATLIAVISVLIALFVLVLLVCLVMMLRFRRKLSRRANLTHSMTPAAPGAASSFGQSSHHPKQQQQQPQQYEPHQHRNDSSGAAYASGTSSHDQDHEQRVDAMLQRLQAESAMNAASLRIKKGTKGHAAIGGSAAVNKGHANEAYYDPSTTLSIHTSANTTHSMARLQPASGHKASSQLQGLQGAPTPARHTQQHHHHHAPEFFHLPMHVSYTDNSRNSAPPVGAHETQTPNLKPASLNQYTSPPFATAQASQLQSPQSVLSPMMAMEMSRR